MVKSICISDSKSCYVSSGFKNHLSYKRTHVLLMRSSVHLSTICDFNLIANKKKTLCTYEANN